MTTAREVLDDWKTKVRADARSAAPRSTHPAAVRSAKWRAANLERARELGRRGGVLYRQRPPDLVKASQAKYVAAHPARARAFARKASRKRKAAE